MKIRVIAILLLILTLTVIKVSTAQLGVHALTRLFPRPYKDLMMADMPSSGMTVLDGAITYCSDCAIPVHPGDKCTEGTIASKGAEAHRIRGEWKCY